MTIEEIKELINVVTQSGIAELEVQRGENRVWIKRSPGGNSDLSAAAPPMVVASAPAAPPAAPAAGPVPATPPPAYAAAEAPPPADVTSDPSLVLVKSPIVGTFYEAPAPGAAPFVSVGDVIKPGQVLCIIESMKLMNEIEAEVAGTIVAKLVENAKPVEYGEALFAVKPS